MELLRITDNKKQFLELLLLADEQESMIDRYLERGELFALYEDGLKSICVVTEEAVGVREIKNLATRPDCRRQGYGKALIGWILEHYSGVCETMLVGTGDCPSTLSFYKACGFRPSHRIVDFFTNHYDHPIIENGVLLRDMVYLKAALKQAVTDF